MKNNSKIILATIALTILVFIISIFIVLMVASTQKPNSTSNVNTTIQSYPVSFASYPTSFVSSTNDWYKNYSQNFPKEDFTSYIKGGSSFNCTDSQTCNQIVAYYGNLNNKNYDLAYSYVSLGRDMNTFIDTYKNYKIINASYIKQLDAGLFQVSVTLISNDNQVEYYVVKINADSQKISQSIPVRIDDPIVLDCQYQQDYLNPTESTVCVFRSETTRDIINLYNPSLIYRPLFITGKSIGDGYYVMYNGSGDAEVGWYTIYAYNPVLKKIKFIGEIAYQGVADINNLCQNGNNSSPQEKDLLPGGCAEKYLSPEDLQKEKEYFDYYDKYLRP